MKEFELLDIATADMAFAAYGKTKEELFANAGKALISIMYDGEIEPKISKHIEIEANEGIVMLQKWLSEILYLHDSKRLLFSKFDIKIEGDSLIADIYGEKYDPKKHKFIIDVKAITYHKMGIEKIEEGYRCVVVVDV